MSGVGTDPGWRPSRCGGFWGFFSRFFFHFFLFDFHRAPPTALTALSRRRLKGGGCAVLVARPGKRRGFAAHPRFGWNARALGFQPRGLAAAAFGSRFSWWVLAGGGLRSLQAGGVCDHTPRFRLSAKPWLARCRARGLDEVSQSKSYGF